MLRSILGSRAAASAVSLTALDEPQALEAAMYGASFIVDDDMERAEQELDKGNSVFHKQGKALVTFLRAVLGFERDVMKEAQERLNETETAASAAHSHAQRDPSQSAASIYSPGTEYALVLAEVRLMSAVLGVLTESVTEALRGFYKLRQAYLTLDAIQQEEKKYLERNGIQDYAADESKPTSSLPAPQPDLVTEGHSSIGNDQADDSDSDDDQFMDADENHGEKQTPKYLGRLSTDDELAKEAQKTAIKDSPSARLKLLRRASTFQEGPGMDVFGDNIVDGFIHSGSSMCYGIIQLLLSLLPPTMNTLIKIAGFRGDRVRGLALLWQASKFTNINGAFSGLVLLGFYNGFVGFCDILPTRGRAAYPEAKCAALLQSFRHRYPKSRLWILEEARMLASKRNLEKAVALLDDTPEANLKQVRALQSFEKSLSNMSLHRYEACSEGFQRCIKLNNWSHGLYYFVAGVAYVERYRELLQSDPKAAQTARAKAIELLKKAPEHVGKKKMMGKQLPFDAFVGRKLQKWEHRGKEWKCELVDAIGVAPIEEMIYFWNGYKRMSPNHLETSLAKLDWIMSEANRHWSQETVDEISILNLLKAVVLRNLGRLAEAREYLEVVLSHSWPEFKGGLKDNWALPAAHYEIAVTYWKQYGEDGERGNLTEAKKWLEKAVGWEDYDLDARIGIRAKTGLETINKEIEALES